MGSPPSEHRIGRFVHSLLITGAWLDEVLTGLTGERPKGRYPDEQPRAVVFEMLCGTIATALQPVDSRDLRRATELIDLAASRVEEHLKSACDLPQRMHDGAAGDRPTHG